MKANLILFIKTDSFSNIPALLRAAADQAEREIEIIPEEDLKDYGVYSPAEKGVYEYDFGEGDDSYMDYIEKKFLPPK